MFQILYILTKRRGGGGGQGDYVNDNDDICGCGKSFWQSEVAVSAGSS